MVRQAAGGEAAQSKTPAPGAWNGGLDRALEALRGGSWGPGNRGEIPVWSRAVSL